MVEKCLENMEYAARRLNISEQRAYELARQNLIPVIRLGRQLRVDPDELENFIQSGGQSLPGGWRKIAHNRKVFDAVFPKERWAAMAADLNAVALFGEYARRNFPDAILVCSSG